MDAQLKAKWIEALRSGKYAQAVGRLRDDENCYCCLGVLCDISGLGLWGGNSYRVDDDVSFFGLPGRLQKEAGLSLTEAGELWGRNDGICGRPKCSFEQIADYIEANIPADVA